MAYYDVDAILTDAQKLPCKFELDVPGLGYLEGNAGHDIKSGSTIDLPLWLGVMLASGDNPLVSLSFPEPLQKRVINALKADPKSVDLRAQAQHFYSLSARILDLFEDDEVVDVLIDTFKKRATEIADHANNPKGIPGDGVNWLQTLDETERQLFRAAHDGAKGTRTWATDLKKG